MEAVVKTEENKIPILLTHCTNPMRYGAEVKSRAFRDNGWLISMVLTPKTNCSFNAISLWHLPHPLLRPGVGEVY